MTSLGQQQRFIFIIACHIRSVFDARILSMALFALHRFHPEARAVLVDNGSPTPITHSRLPAAAWINAGTVAIVNNAHCKTREYGAYDRALRFLAGARAGVAAEGSWGLHDFDQFVFMQASLILTEAVPAIEASTQCAMKPLFTFAMGDKESLYRMQSYLGSVGLDRVFNVSAKSSTPRLQAMDPKWALEPYVAHTSMLATQTAARLLLGHPYSPYGYFHNVSQKLASKTSAEALAGVLVNRISLILSNGAANKCAVQGVAWRGSGRPGAGYRQDAAPAYRSLPVGYRKVHCSDWAHIIPLDVTLAALISIADSDADGLVTRAELARSIVQQPSISAQLHRATCLSLPIGQDSRLRQFVIGGAQKRSSVPDAKPMSHAWDGQRSSGTSSRAAAWMYWAQESLALLHQLPTNQSVVMAQIKRHAEPLMEPFVRSLSRSERFWGAGESADDTKRSDYNETVTGTQWHAAAREYAEALFGLADGDADGLLSFDELRAAARPSGLAPLCWRAGTWLGDAAATQTSGANGDAHSRQSRLTPGVNASAEASIDFAGRLSSLQTEFQSRKPYHSWLHSDVLAPSLIASSMLYLRASVCCLRSCGVADERPVSAEADCRRCRSFSTQLCSSSLV